jgi:ComF family protein
VTLRGLKCLRLASSNSGLPTPCSQGRPLEEDLLGTWRLAVGSCLRQLTDGAAAVLLAPICAACRTPLEKPTRGAVCPGCWAAIVPITAPWCRTCGDPLASWRVVTDEEARCPRCRSAPPHISLARAIGPYEGSLRAIVHALKYDGRPTIARHLAARMRAAGSGLLEDADVVVPVPLHGSRERARGFNQARELARHLGRPCADALARTRKTPSQADLPAARRHANVQGAFRIAGRIVARQTIVLIDDVSTTGATLNACAAALLDAGAKEVRALTAAKAVALRP